MRSPGIVDCVDTILYISAVLMSMGRPRKRRLWKRIVLLKKYVTSNLPYLI